MGSRQFPNRRAQPQAGNRQSSEEMNDIDLLIDPYRGLTDEERIIAAIIQIAAYILSLFLCIVICALT